MRVEKKTEKSCKLFLFITQCLPKVFIKKSNTSPKIFLKFTKKIDKLNERINTIPLEQKDYLVKRYIIPAINILFDKNYVNAAQYTLLILDNWFLSKETEKDLEDAMGLFSEHAINAGLRYRAKYPLPNYISQGKKKIGIVSCFVDKMGFEVVLGLSKYFNDFSLDIYAMKSFKVPRKKTFEDVCKEKQIKVHLCSEEIKYNVFALRQLLIDNPVDLVMWPLPPFQMFFFFAFGLANKQIWFSQYLRSNLNFKYLDEVLTIGGAGHYTQKEFNGRMWNILPQITYIERNDELIENNIVLFSPARLEKIRQESFLHAVAMIMKECPNTIFKWTGCYEDTKIKEFFILHDLGNRNQYIPWLSNENLLREIKNCDVILSTFPLALGTVEIMASIYKKPIISMYNKENTLYWRDSYWEACQGNQDLRKICMNENGESVLAMNESIDEYVNDAINIINHPKLAKFYGEVFHKAYNYSYLDNPNDISKNIRDFVQKVINVSTQNTVDELNQNINSENITRENILK